MKICVFGAGAIGGVFAAYLARHGGHDVSAVLRGQRLTRVEQDGLAIALGGETWRTRVRATSDTSKLGPQDLVIVTLKAPAIPAAIAAIKPLLGPETTVAFVMNGIPWWYYFKHGGAQEGRRFLRLDPKGEVWDGVGPERVIGGVAICSATVQPDGTTIHLDYPDFKFEFGEPDRVESARLRSVVDAMNAAGLHSSMVADIRQRIWAKLVMNISSGPSAVLTLSPLRDVFAQEGFPAAAERMIAEAVDIARAAGVTLDIDVKAAIAKMSKSGHKPSILQDFEAGRPMEIDGLYTAPLEIARLLGVDTPALDFIIGLAKLRARVAGLYPA